MTTNPAELRLRAWKNEASGWKRLLARGLDSAAQKLNPEVKAFRDIGFAEMGGATTAQQAFADIIGEQLSDVYSRHLFTNICVHYIAERIASVPLRFYTQRVSGGETELASADDHWVARMFQFWNPHQSDFEAWEWMASYSLLQGTAFAAITPRSEETPQGIQRELYPLYPKWLHPVRSQNDGIVMYEYRGDGGKRIFMPSEIIAIRDFSTDMRFTGMGRIHAARRELNTDVKIREWNENLVSKGVQVSGVLQTESEMKPEAAKKLREEWERRYAGSKNTGGVMVLYNGLQFTPTDLAHKDIHYIEQLRMTNEDLAMAFGIPMELLGEKSANHASLREKRRIFWQDTVRARTRRIQAVLNSSVLPRLAPGLICKFDFSDVDALKPDFGELVKAGQTAVSGALMTPNEFRRVKLDLPEVDGGDVLLIGRGLTPLESAIAEGAATASRAHSGTSDVHDAAKSGALPPQLGRALRSFASKRDGVAKIDGDDFLKAIRDLHDKTETQIRSIVVASHTETEKAISALTADPTTMIAKSEQIVLVEQRQTIVARSQVTLQRAAEKAAGEVAMAIGLEGAVSLRNTAAEAILNGHKRRVVDMQGRSWLKLRTELVQSIQGGESESMMKKRVSQFFRNARANSLTIARTETASAINSASYSTMRAAAESGIPVRAEWNSVLDDHTRADNQFDHASANGLTIDPATERFIVSGEALRFPGDSENGSAGNIINCRCAMRPVVERRAASSQGEK